MNRQALLRAVQGLNLGLLVATEHQRVFRWGQVHTDHIRNFSANCRSFDSLKVFTKFSLRPFAEHTRCTVALLTPTALAIVPVLQCAAPFGFSCVVLCRISSIFSVGIEGLRPGRGESFSTSTTRSVANRARHNETVFFDVPSQRRSLRSPSLPRLPARSWPAALAASACCARATRLPTSSALRPTTRSPGLFEWIPSSSIECPSC
jgi:hypothetical protein